MRNRFEKCYAFSSLTDAPSSKAPQLTLRIAMQTRKTLRVFLVVLCFLTKTCNFVADCLRQSKRQIPI